MCAISFNFETLDVAAGDINGDGAAGWSTTTATHWSHGAGRAGCPGHGALTIIINAGDGNDEINVRGVNRACGKSPTHTAFTVEIAGHGFKSTTVDMSQAEINGTALDARPQPVDRPEVVRAVEPAWAAIALNSGFVRGATSKPGSGFVHQLGVHLVNCGALGLGHRLLRGCVALGLDLRFGPWFQLSRGVRWLPAQQLVAAEQRRTGGSIPRPRR